MQNIEIIHMNDKHYVAMEDVVRSLEEAIKQDPDDYNQLQFASNIITFMNGLKLLHYQENNNFIKKELEK
jgi:hypothetical protein